VHNLNEIQRKIDSDCKKRKESRKEKKHSRSVSRSNKSRYSSPSLGESLDSLKESRGSLDRSLGRRRKHRKDELQGELRKIKPPIFKGDSEKGEDAQAWLLGMRKYFRIYNYSSQMESNIVIHQLQGQASIWWEQLERMKKLDERYVSWKQFKKYFQQKYLSEHYFERKMQ